MNSNLFKAILSMDAYNRGYSPSLRLTGNKIGNYTIQIDSSDPSLNIQDQAAGFYGVAYKDNTTGAITISYRGTDTPPNVDAAIINHDLSYIFTPDVWNGWFIGAGSVQSKQAELAIKFYQGVVGGINNIYASNVSLTGHSLGGGLAGYVAGAYNKSATTFDQMPYQFALQKLKSYVLNPDDADKQKLLKDVYGTNPISNNTDLTTHKSYSVDGEALSSIRGNSVFGVVTTSTIPNTAFSLGTEVTLLPLRPEDEAVARHSISTLVIRMYFSSQDLPTGTPVWDAAAKYFWPILYNNVFANSIGMNSILLSGTDRDKVEYSSILRQIIAYSAIDEGENNINARPFGDTAIRAFYDDANDLGRLLSAPNAFSILKDHATDISKIFVQFAGQTALDKVLSTDVVNYGPAKLEGAIEYYDSVNAFQIRFAPEIWGNHKIDDTIFSRTSFVDSMLNAGGYGNVARNIMTQAWGTNSADNFDSVFFYEGSTNFYSSSYYSATNYPKHMVMSIVEGGSNADLFNANNLVLVGEGNNFISPGGGTFDNGNDIFIVKDNATGDNTYQAGQGINVISYHELSAGVTAIYNSGDISVHKAGSGTDTLSYMTDIYLTSHNDTIEFVNPYANSGQTWYGGGGYDSVIINDLYHKYDMSTDTLYNGSDAFNRFIDFDIISIRTKALVVDDTHSLSLIQGTKFLTPHATVQTEVLDYSAATHAGVFYTNQVRINNFVHNLPKLSTVAGTNFGDKIYIDESSVRTWEEINYHYFISGRGNDELYYTAPPNSGNMYRYTKFNYGYTGGDDVIHLGENTMINIVLDPSISFDQVSYIKSAGYTRYDFGSHGSLTIHADFYMQQLYFGNNDIYNYYSPSHTGYLSLRDGLYYAWDGRYYTVGAGPLPAGTNFSGMEGDDTLVGYQNRGETINGNAGDDEIYGNGGNDRVNGGLGNDYLDGGDGDDQIIDSLGDNVFTGGKGTDILVGGIGSDTYLFDIGDGYDTIQEYSGGKNTIVFGAGITADNIRFEKGSVSNYGSVTLNIYYGSSSDVVKIYDAYNRISGQDYRLIDKIILDDGTIFNPSTGMTFKGTSGSDTLTGTDGNDIIEGLDGDDYITDYYGIDTASYISSSSAVTVNLSITTAQNTFGAGTDTITGFENLTGSAFNDTLTGNFGVNTIDGKNGNDLIQGGLGNDILIGGDGIDTISYTSATAAIAVNLSITTAQDTGMDGIDTITGFENILGSSYNDTLTGDANANTITGGLGNDILIGGAGIDTVSYTSATSAVTINLTTSAAQNTGGAGTDTITGFENILGSSYNDILTGDVNANTITGGDGNDLIQGGLGNDILNGGLGTDTASYTLSIAAVTVNLATTTSQNTVGAGTDTITAFENILGSAYNDTLTGDGNANTVEGGLGNDILNGGAGIDTISYISSTSGVVVNLITTTAQNTVGAGTDTITAFENILGSAYNDTLTGDGNANTVEGGLGNDILNGGVGADTVSYISSTSAVTVNLATTTAQNTVGAGTDTITAFENILGSAYNDTLTGDGNANTITGGEGNDTVQGGLGNDILAGGNGIDTVSYSDAAGAITLSLASITAQNTVNAGTDIISGFENILGSTYNDNLVGDASANAIDGGLGNDILNGGLGNDILNGNAGIDAASYIGASSAVIINLGVTAAQNTIGAGIDTLISIENLVGTSYADTLTGDGNANIIEGGLGDDMLKGGAGADTVSYVSSTAAVTINLSTTTAQNTVGAGTDTITTFENILGSVYNDTLTGDGNANIIEGGLGNDILNGGAGIDTISYVSAIAAMTVNLTLTAAQDTLSAGKDTILAFENILGSAYNDTLTGDGNANTIEGGLGNDIMNGNAGIDTVSYANATATVIVNLSLMTAQNTVGAGIDTINAFENILGSAYNDTLTGDSNANTITGGEGNDTVQGGLGNDILAGGNGIDTVSYSDANGSITLTLVNTAAQNTFSAGLDAISGFENILGSTYNDSLTGDANSNMIDGGLGNDLLNGGLGNDILIGNGGIDTASYAGIASTVTVSLGVTAAQNTVGAGTDTLIGIENLLGSSYADILTGDGNANVIEGGLGNDILNGGAGIDTVSYASATSATTINLALTTAQNTVSAGTDTIAAFENILGSAYNDNLTGDVLANTIDGGSGNDTIQGGLGNDVLIGGAGTDTVSYAVATAATTINLALATAQNTISAGTDTVSGFENIIGSGFNDTLTGDALSNTIDGGVGSDIIQGGLGNDILIGGAGIDTVSYSGATAAITLNLALTAAQNTVAAGTDTITGFENILGSSYNDTLTGDGNANIIEGGLGNDILNGGAGIDTVSYASVATGVIVNLSLITAQNTVGAGTDTLSNFEDIFASAFNDTLTGSSATNTINGGAGNDLIIGGLGADILTGGLGADTFQFLSTGLDTNFDRITDFSTSQADKINIQNLLVGYDTVTKAITDYIEFTTVGANTVIKVDRDGLGTTYGWQQIAQLDNVTGITDEAAFKASGNLIA